MGSYADDYLIWDNTEAVTLRTVNIGGSDDSASVSTALKEDLNRTDFQTFGAIGLRHDDVAWLLPNTLLGGKEPKAGDVIVDSSSVQWLVKAVNYQVADQAWRCVSTKAEQ